MTRLFLQVFGMVCLSITALRAQDPVFSQFYAAPLQLNPAFAGSAFAPRLTANYRNQWPGWPNAYASYSVGYEQWIDGMNSGIGLMLMGDDAGNGIYRTTHVAANYSYQVQVADKLYFRLGMEAGFIQSRINWNALVFGDQLNPVNGSTDGSGNPNTSGEIPPDQFTTNAFDASAGLLVFSPRFHAGVSLKHLNTPDISFLRINPNLYTGVPLRLAVHAGVEIPIINNNKSAEGAFLSPNVMLMSQGGFSQLNGGMYAGLGKVFTGAWYRHTFGNADAVILLGGFRYGILRIGYSYDLTLSALADAGAGGAHEISFALNLGDSREMQRKRKQPDLNDCFKIFR